MKHCYVTHMAEFACLF